MFSTNPGDGRLGQDRSHKSSSYSTTFGGKREEKWAKWWLLIKS